MELSTGQKHYGQALIVASLCGFFVWYPITDGDIFWHLAAGREIINRFDFLRTDPFSFTSLNIPWFDFHWFFQVLVFMTYIIGGYTLLQLLQSVIIASSVFFLYRVFPSGNMFIKASLFILTFFEIRYLLPLRPTSITFLCISIFIWAFNRYHLSNNKKYLYVLLPLQVVWVNSQGLFLIGPAIAGTYLVSRYLEKFLIDPKKKSTAKSFDTFSFSIFISVILVNVLNPYTLKSFTFPFKLFSMISPSSKNVYSVLVDENTPLLSLFNTPDWHQAVSLLISVLIGIVLFRFIRLKRVYFSAIVAVVFLIPAFMAQRNIALYLGASIPLIGLLVTEYVDWSKQKAFSAAISGFLFSLVVCTVILHGGFLLQYQYGALSPFVNPEESVEILQRNNFKGRVFNADRFGGYITWKMYPYVQVFIDTRFINEKFFFDYLKVIENPRLLKQIVEKWDIKAIILPIKHGGRYENLYNALLRDSEWFLQYADGDELLLTKEPLEKVLDLTNPDAIRTIEKQLRIKYIRSRKLTTEALIRFRIFVVATGV